MTTTSTENLSAPESEQTVLGAVLLHQRCLADVLDVVKPDDFTNPMHEAIFEAMLALDGASQPIDTATLRQRMAAGDTWKKLNHVGGEAYLLELQAAVVSVENVRYHAIVVSRKARRRAVVLRLNELRTKGLGKIADDAYLDEVEAAVLELSGAAAVSSEGPVSVEPSLRSWVTSVEERAAARLGQGEASVTGIPSGFADLDAITAGLHAGQFIVLAARPSMGKSALIGQASVNVARAGFPVLGFSLEMSTASNLERLVSSEGRINGQRIRRGDLEVKHWTRLHISASGIAGMPIWLDDSGTVTISDIRARARRWRQRHAPGKPCLVWVDYIGLVSPSARGAAANREREVAEVSRGLKLLAKDLNCVVVGLAQLNRNLEARDDKRPRLSDLRESGSLEQDADAVWFLYRDEVYCHDCKRQDGGEGVRCEASHRNLAEVIVAKQRNGPCFTAKLRWLPWYTRFETLTRENAA